MYIWKYCKSGNFCYDLNFFFFAIFFGKWFWESIAKYSIHRNHIQYCLLYETFKLWTMVDANQKKLHIFPHYLPILWNAKKPTYTVCNGVTLFSFWVIRHVLCNKCSLNGLDAMLLFSFIQFNYLQFDPFSHI